LSLLFPAPWPQPPALSFLRLKLLRANPAAKVSGVNELPGKSNYLTGNDPKQWRTNVPTYGRVRYENIYPGVDLVYYGKQGGQLEYDFVVAPGADPSAIALAIDAGGQVSSKQKAASSSQPFVVNGSRKAGSVATDHAPRTTDSTQSKIQNRKSKISSSLRIAANGDLIVTAEGGEVRFHKPVVYQEQSIRLRRNSSQLTVESETALDCTSPDNGPRRAASLKSKIQNRKLIDGRYILKSDGEVTFEIAPYDRTRPLIIDPVLSYSTYLGGSDMDYANGIAVDPSGSAYVTGYTASIDFPLANPAQSSPGGGTCSDGVDTIPCFDAFVTKLNPAGTALVYSTYLGGSNEDYGTGIALDASGDAYVTGYTNSTDFPVQNALQAENAGGYDAFVAELSADGAFLIYSTYRGGSGDDIGTGIAVDSSGNAYISGYTASPDFPVTPGALQTNYGGGDHDGFVVKFNSGGAKLGYSTFLGGSADDYAYGVAVDSAGDAYVTGATNSANFPTLNAFQPNYAGGLCAVAPNTFPCYDAFVAKLNPAGSALIYATYLGGTGSDYGYAIALDGSSNAYVTGYTISTNFPTTAGAYQRVFGGSYDAFVAKLNGAGSALVYSTYLGGPGTEIGYDIAVDSLGRALVTGYNYGGQFPTVSPTQAQNAGFYDAFVSVLNASGSSLDFSTYLGGSLDEVGRGISLDPSGNAYVTGGTFSLDFPITSGSYQPSYGGGPYDAFVTKFDLGLSPFVNLSPPSYNFGNQVVGTTSSAAPITLTNTGNATLNITSVTIAGTNSGDFSQTNTCGASLAANASCTLSVTFTPTASGLRSGSLTITDSASPATQSVSLTGTGVATPLVSLSPPSLTFPAQKVGTSSSAQSVTLKNTGSAVLSITSITVSGDFSQTNTCGSSLAANASCTLSVTFTPTASGLRSGSLTITDNASPATQTVSLTGTGTAPVASLSPTSLTFPAQPLGTSSSAQSVTLSNTGSAALSITSITASGDFSQTNTCGSSLAANASCTFSVTFTPTASGSRNGSLTITDSASPATQIVSLTGTGTAPVVSLSPTSLTFPAQPLGTSSSAQSVTLSNTGSAVLSITSITASGDFSQTNTCGSSLAANASCTFGVAFTPTASGSRSGSLTITDNASPATQTVSLTGTGVATPLVSLSPTSLTFPAQPVGTSSSAQSVTLSNTGSAVLSITSITVSGDFSQTNTCGSSLAANASCTFSVTFTPTASGSRSGSLTITDSASPATQTVSLTGTGTAPVVSLSPTSLTFPAQPVGTSSSAQSVTLSNTGSAVLSITSITASGDFSQTNTCGSSLAANASCTFGVAFTPTASGSRSGSLTITDNASPATQTVSLTGTGVATPLVSLSPTSLTFPAQPVGTSSSAQSVTLSNTGSAVLSITSITVSGDFSQTNTCGSSLAANASCTFSVTFTPTASGSRSGSLTITDNASPATQSVSLTGTGVATPLVSLSPPSLTFPAQKVGTSSSAQSVTLKNTGSAVLSITSITVSGDFSQTNTCGSSVAVAASCTLSVTFKPTATGTRTGAVTITDNGSPATQSVSLTGTGTAPVVSLSPTSLTFPAQPLGTSSSAQSVTLSNTGNASLGITSIKASGDFSQTNTCGSSVAASASCTLSVTFKPTAAGTRTGVVTITDNASPATQTVSLTGTGVATPLVSLSPASLTFPAQNVGTSSSAHSATLKNTGSATLRITSITVSGDFSQTNTCGPNVAAGASCTLSVTFKPTAAGTRTGAITITDNASPATQTINLTGTGIAPVVTLSPASLTFPAQKVGTSSSAQSVTLSNTGNASLGITSIKASGDFSQTNTCGSMVAANASCTLSVTFKPTATGTRTGAVTITDNATPATQTVSLAGTGASAAVVSLSPASLTFPAQAVGTTSNAQSVTLSNTGSAALSITSITASGDSSQANTCGSSVAANANCTLSVIFKPTAAGTRTGAVAIADDAVGSPQTVALTGTGEDFTFTVPPGSSTSATVSPGGTATYTLSVVAVAGFNQNMTFTCTGAPSEAACTVSPSSLTLSSSSTNVTVRVTTTAPSVGAPQPNPLPPIGPFQSWPWLLWTVALAALGSLARATRGWVQPGVGRCRAGFVTFAALMLVMGAMAACGGGGGDPPPRSSSGTPPGTYTLTVTGTCTSGSTNLSNSVNLTLQVQ
jgi:hypothetical protein